MYGNSTLDYNISYNVSYYLDEILDIKTNDIYSCIWYNKTFVDNDEEYIYINIDDTKYYKDAMDLMENDFYEIKYINYKFCINKTIQNYYTATEYIAFFIIIIIFYFYYFCFICNRKNPYKTLY